MKTEEREAARRMRSVDGCSIKEIANALGVSPGSVSVWVRDVVLTEEQINRLVARNPAVNAALRGTPVRAARERERRRQAQADGRRLAKSDPVFTTICMLHWAEGSKSRNSFVFTNSDPSLLRYASLGLRTTFDLDPSVFRVYCNCSPTTSSGSVRSSNSGSTPSISRSLASASRW
jgi:transposase-like protein